MANSNCCLHAASYNLSKLPAAVLQLHWQITQQSENYKITYQLLLWIRNKWNAPDVNVHLTSFFFFFASFLRNFLSEIKKLF